MIKKRIVVYPIVFAVFLSMCFSAAVWADSEYSAEQKDFSSEAYFDTVEVCALQIQEKTDFEPDIAIVLGSGLGDFADNIEVCDEIPYSEIIGFPVSTAPGHEGKLIFGICQGKKLVIMKGRIHYYEGYSMYDTVLPLRTLSQIGVKTVILTNAVGAINEDYNIGEFVAVNDHISSFVPSPLIGENIEELGERYTDMTHVYDKDLHDLVLKIGEEKDITVHSGVYLQTTGPQYETPAEIRMYRGFGADVVGMSAAVEAIAARHMGMKVCSVCCITNMAAGIEDVELSHEHIKQKADTVSEEFTLLISSLIERMPE